jgi:hypothetical protein
MKKIFSFLVIFSFLINNFLIAPKAAQAAAPVNLGGVTYATGVVLFDGEPSANEFISNSSTLTPNDIDTSRISDPITAVELKDSSGTVVGTMNSIGSNKYHLNTPLTSQTVPLISANNLDIDLGPFEWFRDPNQTVWMYDYDEPPAVTDDPLTVTSTNRYYKKTSGIFSSPPTGVCPSTVRQITDPANPPSLPTSFPDSTACNEAKNFRSGILDPAKIGDFSFGVAGKTIPVSKVSKLHFDNNDFVFDSKGGYLKPSNIQSFASQPITSGDYHYRFDYTAVFNVPEDNIKQPASDPNGLVIQYMDGWNIPVKGEVYKYPKLTAWATTSAPTSKTDLSIPSLTGPSCIEAGSVMTFNYKITNSGPATSTPFKVKISADGNEIITQSFSSGIGQETKDGTFTYMFTAVGDKSITVFADSDSILDEGGSTGNNTTTKVFTAVSDCSGGGGGSCNLGSACPGTLTGTLTVHYPTINWKNPNDFQVTINNPSSGCTAAKGRFTVSQGGAEYAYGWTNITNSDYTGFAWGMGGYSGYPGNIVDGTVRVIYTVEDTCGQLSIIGPGNFDIVKPPATKPTVELDWYNTGGAKISEAVQDDFVYLKAVKSDSNNENVTLSWDFTSSNAWVSGLPAKYHWSTPLNAIQYTGIKADVKGTGNKVCVTGTNESGLSSNPACTYLDIIGPEPKAVIDVTGWLKEGRRIELSGARSSSPKNLDLTYAWSITPIAVQTAGTASDISYISPLTGVQKDFKTEKLGKYKVDLVATDTAGLSGNATTTVDVAPDLPPISNIAGNGTAMRQVSGRLLSTFTLLGTGLSVDQDIISKRYWSFTYDGNNDGIYNEPVTSEVDEDALVTGWEYTYYSGPEPLIITKIDTHIITVKGAHVGKYKTRIRVVESPGQPTDLVH